jgi:hypothetical protein
VIRYVNEHFVPVWVDVREEPFPSAPALVRFGSEWDLLLSPDRQICNPYYRCYFVKTYVLSPDLETLLNEEAGVWGMALTEIGDDYEKMLEASVARYEQGPRAN